MTGDPVQRLDAVVRQILLGKKITTHWLSVKQMIYKLLSYTDKTWWEASGGGGGMGLGEVGLKEQRGPLCCPRSPFAPKGKQEGKFFPDCLVNQDLLQVLSSSYIFSFDLFSFMPLLYYYCSFFNGIRQTNSTFYQCQGQYPKQYFMFPS